ncbi:LLM class F420-dependent oxidoreductase [Spongiibacter tropicus]|uniref:LLM class F420-dependent oxidoreductase n=1 Tax=Spongiibacter tropicus TaxID=454602 RepID=UPI003A998208
MKFWQVISWCETEHLVEVARHAEQLGFEGVILAEHIYYPKRSRSHYFYSEDGRSIQNADMAFPDPLISFAAMASVTQRLKMLTGIYVLPLRHPIEAAKNMATLAVLSDNRFMLGFGAGWLQEEFEQFGVDFHRRGGRLDEMLTIMQALWRGEEVSFHGEHFQLDDVNIRPYPSKPVPLIGGGHSGAALRRAVRSCDGWYGPGNTLAELRTQVPALLQARREAGLPTEGYEVIAPLTEPLTPDAVNEMSALGVTATVSYPFLFGIGPDASLAQKKAYMDDVAARFIQ